MATILDCKTIQPKLSEYIDGALESSDTAWAIKMHLSSCAVCETVVSELTQTTSLLRDLPSLDTSDGFEAALARRLADQVLQPRNPTIIDHLREWWSERPAMRPAYASVAALAAALPIAFVTAYQVGATHSVPPIAHVQPSTAPASPSSDPSLDELWNEHMSYASSEPLADSSSGMLQSQSNATVAPPAVPRTL